MFSPVYAATIKGIVSDKEDQEAIIGAVVKLDENKSITTSGIDGSYEFKSVPDGRHTIIISYVGYAGQTKEIEVHGQEIYKLNFVLQNARINEVTIKGSKNNGSDEAARLSEKNAENVMNIVSARAIELSPDLTVANVLERVSGVNIEHSSNGDAQYATIRGMDKRYNYTLVNGVKIPSPDMNNRYVPMDIFPSDLLERLEVVKALTPNMEGDAIGGAMNMVMKSAPKELTIKANAATGFSQYALSDGFYGINNNTIAIKSPEETQGRGYQANASAFSNKVWDYSKNNVLLNQSLGFSIGNSLLKNKKLGFIVAGSYLHTYSTSSSFFLLMNGQPESSPVIPANTGAFTDINLRTYYTETQRYGLHARLDYTFNNHNKISFYSLFVQTNQDQYRHTIDSTIGSEPGIGNVNILDRNRVQNGSIYNATLKGDHDLTDKLRLTWNAVYSLASAQRPDWSTFETSFATKDSSGIRSQTAPTVDALTRQWEHNTDEDMAAYLDLSYKTTIAHMDMTFSAGGLYRHKTRDNFNIIYSISPVGMNQTFTNFDAAQFAFSPLSNDSGNIRNPNNYSVTENTAAWYGMAKVQATEKLQILAGMRVEQTDDNYHLTTLDTTQWPAAVGGQFYTDFLPSVHILYHLEDDKNIRLSYYRAICRPNYFDMIPYNEPGEDYTLIGNPSITRSTADNLDARYEWFLGGASQVLIGAFYKKIYSPIEYAFNTVNSTTQTTGKAALDIMPINGANPATNYGTEIVFTKFFHRFGINVNYTYTHSSITTPKRWYGYNAATNSIKGDSIVNVAMPLQGQAEHIGNIALIYKDVKLGLDAQLALVYTGPHIALVSGFVNNDYWQRGTAVLDLSFEKKIIKKFFVYGKVNNILNTPVVLQLRQNNIYRSGNIILPEQDRSNAITVQRDLYGQVYLIGMRYKF